MVEIRVDGRQVRVPEGGTVLDAARRLGIEIPTMCHLDGLEPSASCLMCLVRVNGSDRLVPSCATPVSEGMEIESETPEIQAARKMSLELLLADHLGECLAPCHRICPLSLDIPRMTRQVRDDDLAAAIADVRTAIPFPGILGRVCSAKCEVGCRRDDADEAVSIRSLERHVADRDRESDTPYLPPTEPDTGRRVAVVGAGPAGLSAAYFLRLSGHAVTVLERSGKPGGHLRHGFDEEVLPHDVLDEELAIVTRLGALVRCGVEVGTDPTLGALLSEYDAVLVAAAGITEAGGPPPIFTAGDAVRRMDDPVRAMASGRDAAADIDAHLAGRPIGGRTREFSTVVGKLSEPAMALYVKGAAGDAPDRPVDDMAAEGARCLRCDCRATATCLLKRYAEELGASHTRFKVKRREFTQKSDHPYVLYEPGKCIACGICVAVTEEMGEELGLTFIGRGFEVRVGVPFDAPLSEALREAARKVVTHCPTGALAFRDGVKE